MFGLVISAIFGAIVGGIVTGVATYFASYRLEQKKWLANAAILRNENVYSPVYDELVRMEYDLDMQRKSFRPIQQGPLYGKWAGLRNSSYALTIPKEFRNFLDLFTPICNEYIPELNTLYQEIRGAFPDDRRCQGIPDNQIASRLAELILIVPNVDYNSFKSQIEKEYPGLSELPQYWTKDRFDQTHEIIQNLPAWGRAKDIYAQFTTQLKEVKEQLLRHIQNIIKEYQPSDPRF